MFRFLICYLYKWPCQKCSWWQKSQQQHTLKHWTKCSDVTSAAAQQVKWGSQSTRSLSFTMLREELRQKMHELGDIFFLHSSIIHPYPVFWKTMFPSLFLWMVLNISVCTVLSSQRPTACLMINVNPTTVKIYSIILYLHACEGVGGCCQPSQKCPSFQDILQKWHGKISVDTPTITLSKRTSVTNKESLSRRRIIMEILI